MGRNDRIAAGPRVLGYLQRTGGYTVIASHAQVVRAGRPAGRVAVRVRGNLFDQLTAFETRLVRFPGSITPGLLVFGPVELREA